MDSEIDFELLKKQIVLFVDDDTTTRDAMKKMLSSKFKEVIVACDGVEGMELFQSKHPDIIISDIEMPNMSGTEFLQLVRQSHPNIPFVVITGYTDKLHTTPLASFALIKPFSSKELYLQLSQILLSSQK